MSLEETTRVLQPTRGAQVASLACGAIGFRIEMRSQREAKWRPINSHQAGETLVGYWDSMHNGVEQMREGKELPSGFAYFRVRR
jgi:hypothetical protein